MGEFEKNIRKLIPDATLGKKAILKRHKELCKPKSEAKIREEYEGKEAVERIANWLRQNVNAYWTGKFNKEGGKIFSARYRIYENAIETDKVKTKEIIKAQKE